MTAWAEGMRRNKQDDLSLVERAYALYRKAVDADPSHAKAHRGLGVASVKLGRLDEAVQSIEEALRLDPADADGKRLLEAVRKMQAQKQGR